jgi:hypothetical protein
LPFANAAAAAANGTHETADETGGKSAKRLKITLKGKALNGDRVVSGQSDTPTSNSDQTEATGTVEDGPILEQADATMEEPEDTSKDELGADLRAALATVISQSV